MNYLRNSPFTLEDIAIMKLSVQLCHNNQNLKTSILCFPKLLYVDFFYLLKRDCILGSKNVWEDIIKMQAMTVCEDISLPHLKPKLLTCIQKIAMQWISWSRQHEEMFNLKRNFCSNFIIPDDWNEQGKLSGSKVANRLVQDKSIDVCERYRIACVYFLDSFIPELWQQIPEQDKKYFCGSEYPNEINEHNLVKLWSYHMVQKVEILISNEYATFWQYGLLHAVETGIIEVVSYCWTELRDVDNEFTSKAAFYALDLWKEMKACASTVNLYNDCKNFYPPTTYYNDIFCFLLSKMNKEQQITFFRESFEDEYFSSVLDCFLEWPYQEFFLPTMSLLWNDLKEDIYVEQLMNLVQIYTDEHFDYLNLNPDFDYQTLLLRFWEQTPKRFKCYLFNNSWTVQKILLKLLLKKSFNIKVIEVIRNVLNFAISEKKKEIFEDIYEDIISEKGLKFFCNTIPEFFCDDEKTNFKKDFILSYSGQCACFLAMYDGDECYANLLLKWGNFSAEKISEYKYELIFEKDHMCLIGDLVLLNKMDVVERIILWCLHSNLLQHHFKEALAETEGMRICSDLLNDLKWEQLKQFITWCFSSEEEIEKFKRRVFLIHGIDIHYSFMSEHYWQETELLYEWFCLSTESIMKFKKDTIFSNACISEVHAVMYDLVSDEWYLKCGGKWECIALYLQWGLLDKDSVHAFNSIILRSYQEELGKQIQKNLNLFSERIQARLGELDAMTICKNDQG